MPGRTGKRVGRTPISAKLVANLITRAGADRVLTLDLHAGQIQGFFDIPTDNLFAAPVMVARHQGELQAAAKSMVVSPDVGGVVRARASPSARCPARHRRQAPRAAGRPRS
jgi:ribose-phosphate pyrophosphokinase